MDLGPLYVLRGKTMLIQWECLLLNLLIEELHKLSAKTLHIYVVDHGCYNNHSGFNLRSVLEKEKLNGANFIDWYCNLRIVLRNEKKEYVLEQQYPDDLHEGANAAAR